MVAYEISGEWERLLTREGRAALPLPRLLLLYLDPFALFMDASRGPAWLRERARCYNRERRGMLLTYLRRWLIIGGASLLGIASTEAMASEGALFVIPVVGFGIGCGIAVAITACTGAAYLLLGLERRQS